MLTRQQLKDLMKTHPGVRPNVLGLVERIIDTYYSEITQQLGDIPPPNSPVNLLMCACDDSGSMQLKEDDEETTPTNGALVERGYNTLIDALKQSTAQFRTMVSTRMFNNGAVHPFVPLLSVPAFAHKPTQWGTPLYRSAVIGMVVLLVKSAILLEESGVRSSITLLMLSDGVNYLDATFAADDVQALAASMFASQRVKFQFIGIGVNHPEAPDYNELFASMGVPNGSIHTAYKDDRAFRRLFGEVTTSIEHHGTSGGGGEMMGGPTTGGGIVEENTEELGALPGHKGSRDGTTLDMPDGTDPWPSQNFGGWA